MYSLIEFFVLFCTYQSVYLYFLKYFFVFPEYYFLILFILFALPEWKFLIVFLLKKLFEYPEHSLIIKFPVRYKLYQYITYLFSRKVKTLPVPNLDWWILIFGSVTLCMHLWETINWCNLNQNNETSTWSPIYLFSWKISVKKPLNQELLS